MSGNELRVLHCPTTVGGNPQGLSRAENRIGLNSNSVTFLQNYLAYPANKVLFKGNRIIDEFRRWYFIHRAMRQFDIIHYNFGSSLSPYRVKEVSGNYPLLIRRIYNWLYGKRFELIDLEIARKKNKVIAVTFQGDDARQGDYCQENYVIHPVHEVDTDYYTDRFDQIKRERITKFDKYADLIYALNPDLLNVLPDRARFLPYAHVDLLDWRPTERIKIHEELHIVHAPTHRAIKGTRYIVSALDRLKAEGVHFRYTFVENMSNREARKIYETADLLVDQLLCGWYGGLAVELMALGTPVVCYIREEDLHFIPDEMRKNLPIVRATPGTIYSVLREWLTVRKQELRSRGKVSRDYVERWHDPDKIAKTLKVDYEEVIAKRMIAMNRHDKIN